MKPDDVEPSTTEGSSPSRAAARFREAAISAFAESGYGGSSTRAIANRIGLSPTAMYPHYKSKEALLFDVSMDGHLQALEAIRSADDPDAPAAARLQSTVSAFAQWQAENHTLARVLQYEIHSLSEEHYHAVTDIRRRTTAIIRDIVLTGCDSGEFTVADVDDVVLAIMSWCVDVCRWFPSATHSEPDRIASLYSGLVLKLVGIAED